MDIESSNTGRIICFRIKGAKKFVSLNDIIMFCTNNRKIDVYTKEEVFDINGTLSEIEAKLKDSGFCRTHQSYLININLLKKITAEGAKLLIEMEYTDKKALLSKGFEPDFYKKILVI